MLKKNELYITQFHSKQSKTNASTQCRVIFKYLNKPVNFQQKHTVAGTGFVIDPYWYPNCTFQ